jgi:serine phosphatase RsbU (regulator of sigma subunit)/CBS domain-containing protein
MILENYSSLKFAIPPELARNRTETLAVLKKPRDHVKSKHSVEKVAKLFLENHQLHSLPVVDQAIPVGIVHRHQLMDIYFSPYGRDLHGKKSITYFMDPNPLIIEEDLPVELASQQITNSSRLSNVQDFIITRNGEYQGMGTILELLEKITTMQILHLKRENMRLAAEVEVTRRLQQMLLPREEELKQIKDLDIAGYMQPAEEVGGDYYDVLNHNGRVKIGIGDVTGHGLESGVLMLMAQTAVRTLQIHDEMDSGKFLSTLNRTLFENVQRMSTDKSMTLILLDYQDGIVRLSGQHEEILVIRQGGSVERIDTMDLGFPIGLEPNIESFVGQHEFTLQLNESVVLYTDGITEAANLFGQQYGIERLCDVLQRHWRKSAAGMRQAVIEDVLQFIGQQKIFDDITLVVLQRRI